MAKKDAYYFSHDSNAITDPKILSMRCDYGLEGYGLFWAILEMMRNESTYKLALDKNTYRAIKVHTGTTIDVEKFINDCIYEYTDSTTGNGLFCSKDGLFWSESFLRRMEQYEDIKEKRSKAGKKAMQKRWGKTEKEKNKSDNRKLIKGICRNKKITNLLVSNNNAITSVIKKYNNVITKCEKAITKNNKLNQIKLNEIKLNKIKSIYLSDHSEEEKNENEKLDKIDEIDRAEFNRIIEYCELHVLDPSLSIEVKAIIQEMYLNKTTKEKIKELNSLKLLYALDNYSKANMQKDIKKPKEYFKACILSAINETALSMQYST